MARIGLKDKSGNYMAKTKYGNRFFCASDPMIDYPIIDNPYYIDGKKSQAMVYFDGIPKKFAELNLGDKTVNKNNFRLCSEFMKDKRLLIELDLEEEQLFKEFVPVSYEVWAKSKPEKVIKKEIVEEEVEEAPKKAPSKKKK